jgi:uncharacterized protein YcbX
MPEVSQIWIYPLKSARGIRVPSAKLALTGFEYDRTFMLVEPKPSKKVHSQIDWQVMTYILTCPTLTSRLRNWPKVC